MLGKKIKMDITSDTPLWFSKKARRMVSMNETVEDMDLFLEHLLQYRGLDIIKYLYSEIESLDVESVKGRLFSFSDDTQYLKIFLDDFDYNEDSEKNALEVLQAIDALHKMGVVDLKIVKEYGINDYYITLNSETLEDLISSELYRIQGLFEIPLFDDYGLPPTNGDVLSLLEIEHSVIDEEDVKIVIPEEPTVSVGKPNRKYSKTLKLKPMKKSVDEAKLKPRRKNIMSTMIREGQQAILFGPEGCGKTMLAYQIAMAAATGTDLDLGKGITFKNECDPMTVVYYDFELSDEDIAERFDGVDFPDNFFRAEELPYESISGTADEVFEVFKQSAEDVGAKFIVIDNLSVISADVENTEEAKRFMKAFGRLCGAGYTVLILSHTTKNDGSKPIESYSLAGSANLSRGLDNLIGINKIVTDDGSGKQYIKHIKARSTKKEYDDSNVICTQITMLDNGMMGHEYFQTQTESWCLNRDRIDPLTAKSMETKCRESWLLVNKCGGNISMTHKYSGRTRKTLSTHVSWLEENAKGTVMELERLSGTQINEELGARGLLNIDSDVKTIY